MIMGRASQKSIPVWLQAMTGGWRLLIVPTKCHDRWPVGWCGGVYQRPDDHIGEILQQSTVRLQHMLASNLGDALGAVLMTC